MGPCQKLCLSQRTPRPWSDPRPCWTSSVLEPVASFRNTTILDEIHVAQNEVIGCTGDDVLAGE